MLNSVEHEHPMETPSMARRRRQKHSPATIPTADDEKKPHEGPLQPRLSPTESRVIKCDAKRPSRPSQPSNTATTQSLLLTILWWLSLGLVTWVARRNPLIIVAFIIVSSLWSLATDTGGYHCSKTEVPQPATHVWQDTSRTEVLLPANARCRSLPSDLSTVDLSDPSKFEPLSSSAQLSRSVVREDEIRESMLSRNSADHSSNVGDNGKEGGSSRKSMLLRNSADHSSNVGDIGKEGGSSRKSMLLRNSADHSSNVGDNGKEGGSSRKVPILLILNLAFEIASAFLDQYSSVDKPEYALGAMLMAFLGLAISLLELHTKISKEKARWRWDNGIPWFYCPTATPSTYRLFGNFENIFGLLSAILQSIKVAADYFLYIRHSVNPIRFNFWSILFAICVLCSHFVKELKPEVSVLHQTDKNV